MMPMQALAPQVPPTPEQRARLADLSRRFRTFGFRWRDDGDALVLSDPEGQTAQVVRPPPGGTLDQFRKTLVDLGLLAAHH